MSDNYAKACSEVLSIIPYIEDNVSKKIPIEFIKMLQNIEDKEYKPNIDFSLKLKEQKLLKETRIILALIYRDYLCTSEERKELLKQEQKEKEKIQKEKQEKYKINFEQIKQKKEEKKIIEKLETPKETAIMEVPEETWYKKIINKILKILRIR